MTLHELAELRDRAPAFRDRAHAGAVLAEMLEALRGGPARIWAVPAGGVPVGAALARALGLPLGAAVVSKLTLPWNFEVGYGAVAFDGSVLLNDELVAGLGLPRATVQAGIAETREKVARRVAALGGPPDPAARAGGPAVLVDDGLASGFTLRSAVRALRGAGAREVIVAVPTASRRSARALDESEGVEVHCPNVRGGASFAVADAYERWSDVSLAEATALLDEARQSLA